MVTEFCVASGILALMLTCVGLYGTISHGVAQRIPEMGLRMALGAVPGEAMLLVLREAEVLVLGGLVIGIPAAIAGSRLLYNLVFGLATTDPVSYMLAIVVLVLVSVVASYLPARRASRADPIVALRSE
jgi:ABC-type antimicrobial peptide transport system permease subunit